MTKEKPKGPTKAQLARKILELNAQLAHAYHFANATLHKAEGVMGSGVLLQLTFLGGKEVIPPVVILDGLSAATIAALRDDLVRSYEGATRFALKKKEGV